MDVTSFYAGKLIRNRTDGKHYRNKKIATSSGVIATRKGQNFCPLRDLLGVFSSTRVDKRRSDRRALTDFWRVIGGRSGVRAHSACRDAVCRCRMAHIHAALTAIPNTTYHLYEGITGTGPPHCVRILRFDRSHYAYSVLRFIY